MLPGKLCIGILEEDNPLKSYFRLKPLLIEEDGKYVAFSGENAYPEEGCIRIVPDKNESSHFKARMRRMGRYCVLDLREHIGENDKIRPNKNYRSDEGERNAHIVYSDVVREPAEDMIFEILPEGDAGNLAATPRVLKGDALETWRRLEDTVEAVYAPDGESLAADEIQRFDLPGFSGETLHFAIRVPAVMPSVISDNIFKLDRMPMMEPPRPSLDREMESRSSPAAADPEKPWISHDLPPKPPVRNENLSPLQQALAAQSGLNPRRSRSLQEIIEDKWRHSRVDQLGHPVPANAMGKPVENPLDRALDALRGAWRIPEIHDRLVNAIAEMQEFATELNERRRALSDSAIRHELEDLEAERLKTLNEIDRLRREKAALRESFKQEIRIEEAEALREATEKTREAQKLQKQYEASAEEARKAAEFAQDAYASLSDGRFEEKLRDFALTSRAAELIARSDSAPKPAVKPSDEAPSREEWIDRLRRAFAVEALEISEAQAANLLVCAALSDSLLLAGSASSDKTGAARALALALGAMDSGNYVEIGARGRHCADAAASDLPAVTLVREANSAPDADALRNLPAAQNRIVISLLSNGGCPVSAEALERGFMLCMESASAQTPWKPVDSPAIRFSPVRMQTLRSAFLRECAEIPTALERRLQKLRDALAMHGVRLSRHTLDLMWRYCAAMIDLNKISPAEALDLAFAQKALPCILAEAPVECLMELRSILAGMPRSLALLEKPLPILI